MGTIEEFGSIGALLFLFSAGWGSLKRGLPETQFEIVVDLKFVNGWLLISPCGGADLLM